MSIGTQPGSAHERAADRIALALMLLVVAVSVFTLVELISHGAPWSASGFARQPATTTGSK